MRREVILVRRHSFTYIFRIAQVCPHPTPTPLCLPTHTLRQPCSASPNHRPDLALPKITLTPFTPCITLAMPSQNQEVLVSIGILGDRELLRSDASSHNII